jgi:hypothetical protein
MTNRVSMPEILKLPLPTSGPWLDLRQRLYLWIQNTRDLATAGDVLRISYRGLQDFVHFPEMARVRPVTVEKYQARTEILFNPERLGEWRAERAWKEQGVKSKLHLLSAMQDLIDLVAERGQCTCPSRPCLKCKACLLSPKWIAEENAACDAAEERERDRLQ